MAKLRPLARIQRETVIRAVLEDDYRALRSHGFGHTTSFAAAVLARWSDVNDLGRRFPDDDTITELHAIATRALANGDDHARALLREQLEQEEFSEGSDLAPGAE